MIKKSALYILFISLFLAVFPLEMAHASGPVAHVYFARRFIHYFPERFNETEKHEFILGNLFPDIRYISKAKRSETHYDKMTLENVLYEPNAFLAGVKMHSYIDLQRDIYIRKYCPKVHNAELTTPHFPTYLKLIEDEVLFYCGNWGDLVPMLKLTHPEEAKYGIPDDMIIKWHGLMALSLEHPPSKVLLLLSISKSPFFKVPTEIVSEWRYLVPKTAKKPEMVQHVESLVSYFEEDMRKLRQKADK